MPEQVPVSEVRRVVIEYEIRVPHVPGSLAPAPQPEPSSQPEPSAQVDIDELVEKVRRELIRTGRIAISRETTRTASPRREPALLKS